MLMDYSLDASDETDKVNGRPENKECQPGAGPDTEY